ncbi:MAG: hypothetical protein ACKORJ_07430 [Bacteroidota bacterium]
MKIKVLILAIVAMMTVSFTFIRKPVKNRTFDSRTLRSSYSSVDYDRQQFN